MMLALLPLALLAGCGPASEAPGPTPAPSPSSVEAIKALDTATMNPMTPEYVAEAFALNSAATDVQREMIKKESIGSVVEWDVVVYEVTFSEGVYHVTSQPVPVRSADSVPLLRVVAHVVPRDEADATLLQAVKTNETLRVRGLVQDIFIRTAVVLTPAVVRQNVEQAHD